MARGKQLSLEETRELPRERFSPLTRSAQIGVTGGANSMVFRSRQKFSLMRYPNLWHTFKFEIHFARDYYE